VESLRGRGVVICTGWRERPLSRQNWALAKRLAEDGVRVVLVLDGKPDHHEDPWNEAKVVTWPSSRPTHARDAAFFWRLLGEHQPDAVLANFGSVNIAMLVGAARRVPIRAAWYRTLTDQIALDEPRMNRAREMLLTKRKQLVYRFATNVVAVSNAARDDAALTYSIRSDKFRVVHSCRPDPLELIGTRPPRASDTLRIACVGRLEPSKGQDVLIRAVGELLRLEPEWDIKLELIGDGAERAHYERVAEESGAAGVVEFAGNMTQLDVYRRLAVADVLAIPVRTDAGPGVIAEGLGSGLPLVVAASGGIPELLDGSSCAVLVPPEDHHAFASGLQAVLTDPGRRADMARVSRELFEARFHLSLWVDEVVAWLDEEFRALT